MATCVNRPWVSVRRAYPQETHAARWFGTLVVGGSSRKGERMATCYRAYRELRIFCFPTRWREQQARVRGLHAAIEANLDSLSYWNQR